MSLNLRNAYVTEFKFQRFKGKQNKLNGFNLYFILVGEHNFKDKKSIPFELLSLLLEEPFHMEIRL